MKKFLLSVLLLIPFWVNAQVYHPLVDSEAVWSEESSALDWFDGSFTDYGGSKFLFNGDSMIEGFKYSLLKVRGTYSFRYKSDPPYIYLGLGIDSTLQLIAGLREDSTRKVWAHIFSNSSYFNWLIADSTILLYDFSLTVGDTFFLSTSLYTTVSTIDSIQTINGEWRRRFQFSTNPCWATNFWIEGIGSDGGLFANYFCPFESYIQLACYKKMMNFFMRIFMCQRLFH